MCGAQADDQAIAANIHGTRAAVPGTDHVGRWGEKIVAFLPLGFLGLF
jgi:hypothetical protein